MQPLFQYCTGTIVGIVLLLSWAMGLAGTMSVDNSEYAALLQAFVHNGHVDYSGFKENEARLDGYLAILEKTDPQQLSREERFSFYVNLYNAWTIKLILGDYPGIDSIRDLGNLFQSAWKKKIVRLGGQVVTLDHIEHEILRPRFKDPRVHFAINCASKGCPPLLGEPYTGSRLDSQLDHVTTAFINDPQRNYLDGGTLYVSRIFKWFAEDFGNNATDFIRLYARGPLKVGLEKSHAPALRYLDYDWSLNNR